MKLLDGYRASLKSLEVEETVDVYVHRPLGYLVAKACFHTPISPDLITLLSIVVGVSAGLALFISFPYHLQIGGLLIFVSAVLDCADGQLARMRKTSSAFGRMIDGTADLITTAFIAPATAFVLWRMYNTPLWLGITVVTLAILTMVTSSFHTAAYDHFKNVYLRLTSAECKEGEDYETALERWTQTHAGLAWWKRISWRIYLFYVKGQRDHALGFDPYTSARLNLFPAYDAQRADIYRKHAGPLMGVWRSVFGFGTLVFGLALFNLVERPDVYLVLRLIVLNGIYYLYLRPAQRRASRDAFREMNLHLPDQRVED